MKVGLLMSCVYIVSVIDQGLSKCLASTKDSKSSFEANICWFKRSRVKITSSTQDGVKLFGSSRLRDEDQREDFNLGLFSFV